MSKLILTDCDGVLLDWVTDFECYLDELGYVKKTETHVYHFHAEYGMTKAEMKELIRSFNESIFMRYLCPIKDALWYVPKLAEQGYKFHVITSQTDNNEAKALRIANLREVFGDVFAGFSIIGTGDDKDEVLKQFIGKAEYWIEDKEENVDVGVELGFKGILISHDYNESYTGKAQVVQTWKEIYEIVTA